MEPAQHFVFHRRDHESWVDDLGRRTDAEFAFESVVRDRGDRGGFHRTEIDRHAIGNLMVDGFGNPLARIHGNHSRCRNSSPTQRPVSTPDVDTATIGRTLKSCAENRNRMELWISNADGSHSGS